MISRDRKKEYAELLKRKPYIGTYQAMMKRCYSPNDKDYIRYGLKGITVCDSWLESYDNFANDMGVKPKGFTLDRINGELGYSKENCRWASVTTQNNNRDIIKNAKGYGITKSGYIRAWAKINNKVVYKYFKTEVEAKEWYENNKSIYSC
jgi:hypothetical protein